MPVPVLTDQAINGLAPFEPDMIEVGGSRRCRLGRAPVSCSVRAVGVVVTLVGGENPAEMLFVVDQEPVGAFASDGADPAFGDRVRPWCADRCPDHSGTERGEHLIEHACELRVAVPDEELQLLGSVAHVHG
jgi:hypothetical protein